MDAKSKRKTYRVINTLEILEMMDWQIVEQDH